jgi:hypothetical protein
MAQEIVRLCDPHLIDHRTREPGQPYTVDLGNGPRVLDLCVEHHAELLKPLADALDLYGVKPVSGPIVKRRNKSGPAAALGRGESGRAAIPDGVHACPFCTFTVNAISAMYRHMEAHHGFHGLQATMQRQCPLCGDRFAKGGTTSLAGHVQTAHAEPSVSRALLAARAAGDPYGVDARVQAAASA